MKAQLKLVCIITILAFVACKKNDNSDTTSSTPPPPPAPAYYTSVNDFFAQNSIATQSFTINASTGGSFTSLQGTVVIIPANAFLLQSNGNPVTGNVKVNFKDIFKKSDMLLSGMPTTTIWGRPLRSGGEFFIQATANGAAVMIAPGKKIDVALPAALTGGIDNINAQTPWVWANNPDSVAGGMRQGWTENPEDSIIYATTSYIYSLYSFNSSAESGRWCNSDNSTFFSNYTTTQVTFVPTDNMATYGTQVFLVFKSVNSMVHVYNEGNSFPYHYAPQGLECTMVAVGVKDGNIYSAFVPVTITPDLSVNFTLAKTTNTDFINHLKQLN